MGRRRARSGAWCRAKQCRAGAAKIFRSAKGFRASWAVSSRGSTKKLSRGGFASPSGDQDTQRNVPRGRAEGDGWGVRALGGCGGRPAGGAFNSCLLLGVTAAL